MCLIVCLWKKNSNVNEVYTHTVECWVSLECSGKKSVWCHFWQSFKCSCVFVTDAIIIKFRFFLRQQYFQSPFLQLHLLFICFFFSDAVNTAVCFHFLFGFRFVLYLQIARKWNHYQEANHNNSNNEIMRIQCANQPIQQWLMDHSWPQKKCQNVIFTCLC